MKNARRFDCLVEFLQPRQFQRYKKSKLGAIYKVTSPQAPRLTKEAEEPLQTVFTHPLGRLCNAIGVKIKSGAHAYEDRNLETITVLEHPTFLLWRAQAHPDDIGP